MQIDFLVSYLDCVAVVLAVRRQPFFILREKKAVELDSLTFISLCSPEHFFVSNTGESRIDWNRTIGGGVSES